MGVVTAYIYDNVDAVIHMEAPPEFIIRVNYHTQGGENEKWKTYEYNRPFCYTQHPK